MCFRHKIEKDKPQPESRLNGIFCKKPTEVVKDYIVFFDPPMQPGNDRMLNEFRKGQESTELPESVVQDFDVAETISQMEKQLSAAIDKGHEILQAARGINLDQRCELLQKTNRAAK